MDSILAIIPVHNRRDATVAVLESLRTLRATGFQLDVLIIDDGSIDGTPEAVATRFPEAAIVRADGNLWWGGALNVGFRHALERGYDYVYILNDDIELSVDTLDELHKAATKMPDTACGSVSIQRNGLILSAGFRFSRLLYKLESPYKNKPYATLAQDYLQSETLSTQSTLIPTSVLKKGLFVDQKRFPHNYSDLEYFTRLRKEGFRLAIIRKSVILSRESSSNYHLLLARRKLLDVFRSFTNIKYAHNIITQWNIASNNNFPISGALKFIFLMSPYACWLLLKIALPKSAFVKLLITLKKVPADFLTKS